MAAFQIAINANVWQSRFPRERKKKKTGASEFRKLIPPSDNMALNYGDSGWINM